MELQIITAADRPELRQKEIQLNEKIWPEFMLHDAVSNKWFAKLYEIFPDYQFWLTDSDAIAAIGNSIPLAWQEDISRLPVEGWDWAIEKGFQDNFKKEKPNFLCGLLIAVAPEHRGSGLSGKMIEIMQEKARLHQLEKLIIPVRPSLKSKFPLMEMADYISWCREDGQLFDPWLRVHQRRGAQIIKICAQAMRIEGSVNDWQNWTGREFPGSGKYIIPGALQPVEIDLDDDRGVYLEPNVWVCYEI